MKNLKQYITEEITKLSEAQFPAPPEILDALMENFLTSFMKIFLY